MNCLKVASLFESNSDIVYTYGEFAMVLRLALKNLSDISRMYLIFR